MIRTSFNDNWTVGDATGPFDSAQGPGATPLAVRLPHDRLLDFERSAKGTSHTGYFPAATASYAKTFAVPAEYVDRRVSFEFDGVYRDAMVFINGDFAGQRPNGYTQFRVAADPFLRYGESNEIIVVSRVHDDSRWYSGLGIHRDVRMLVGGLIHVEADGLRITTPDIEPGRALISTEARIANADTRTRTVSVHTRLIAPDGAIVAEDIAPATLRAGSTVVVRGRMIVRDPLLWSVSEPHLYRAEVELTLAEGALRPIDSESTSFGIRSLQLDAERGLRINGQSVTLRGACIHHDNGIIGSAAIRRADERRVELLKEAGFNAIRSAHNPMSPAMLDACDRLGMLVIDETFDVWTQAKTPHDYSLAFAEWFERDVDSLIAKDFNHPSVIMYSIGNEIPETSTPLGSGWGRRIAERFRSQDPHRFLTNSINAVLAVMPELGAAALEHASTVGNANEMMSTMGALMQELAGSDIAAQRTAESFAVVDVAGINYGDSRYERDHELFPNRVIVGSETFPTKIAEIWRLVLAQDHVIGDFTWTGWDYLGEAGIGRVQHGDGNGGGFAAAYPWLLAWCGDIDITGHRRPASYYREIVFDIREEPYIAVQRPQHHGLAHHGTPWSWTDSASSWNWDVPIGSPLVIEVYSPDPEVELFVNGKSLGVQPSGPENEFRAQFEARWEPGEIIAIGMTADGKRTASSLKTAEGSVRLRARADREVLEDDDGDLAFIHVTLEDDAGVVATHLRREVTVEVAGTGALQGFGSADPATTDRYRSGSAHTFDGRALAVIRPTGRGEVVVTFRSESDVETVTLQVESARE